MVKAVYSYDWPFVTSSSLSSKHFPKETFSQTRPKAANNKGSRKLIFVKLGSIIFQTVLTVFHCCRVFHLTAFLVRMKTAAKSGHKDFIWNLPILYLLELHLHFRSSTAAQPEQPNSRAASQHAQTKGTEDHRIKDIHCVGAHNTVKTNWTSAAKCQTTQDWGAGTPNNAANVETRAPPVQSIRGNKKPRLHAKPERRDMAGNRSPEVNGGQ